MLCLALPARTGPPPDPIPRHSPPQPPRRQNHTDGARAGHPAFGQAESRQSRSLARQGVMEMDQGDRPVLVTGATGNTGRPIVAALTGHGMPVRAMARPARGAWPRAGGSPSLAAGLTTGGGNYARWAGPVWLSANVNASSLCLPRAGRASHLPRRGRRTCWPLPGSASRLGPAPCR